VFLTDDRAMVAGIGGERAFAEAAIVAAIAQSHVTAHQRPQLLAVAIAQLPVIATHDGLGELIDVVDTAAGVHPARTWIEALVDEELAPGHGTIGIQSFIAAHLQFRAEEEAGM